MALITNFFSTSRSVVITILAAIILLGATSSFASGNSEAEARKAKILSAEQTLADLGYWITKVDGVSDDSTRQAIIAFQKVEGLKRTGVLNDEVLNAIRSRAAPRSRSGR